MISWHRFYDPETGRYISADPIGLAGGLNLYAYANQDPINWFDPEGLDAYTVNGTINIPFLGGIEVGFVQYTGNGIENYDLGVYGTIHKAVGGFALAKGSWGVSQTVGCRENFDGEDIEVSLSVLEVGVSAGGFENGKTPTSVAFDVGPQLGYEVNATATASFTIGDIARGVARHFYGDAGSIFENGTCVCE